MATAPEKLTAITMEVGAPGNWHYRCGECFVGIGSIRIEKRLRSRVTLRSGTNVEEATRIGLDRDFYEILGPSCAACDHSSKGTTAGHGAAALSRGDG